VPDPAVFLDRDGTLIEEVGYASRPGQIRILGGVARALIDLADAGYRLIVVTNQSGIARGYMTEEDLERFHDALDQQLHLLGAAVDAYYACPHHPDPGDTPRPDLAVACDCRKPKPGLLLRAAEDFRLDLEDSWTVGDMWRDIAAGQAAGTRTIKLPADPEHDAPRPPDVEPPSAEAANLAEAADIILGRRKGTARDGAQPVPVDAGAPSEPAAVVQAPTAAQPSPEAAAAETEGVPAAEPAVAGAGPEHAEAPPEPTVEGFSQAPPAPAKERIEEERPTTPSPPVEAAGHCARCGRDIFPSDIAAGAAGERNGFLLCAECLSQQPREAAEAGPDAGADRLLRSILAELQRLRRSQRPSSFSAVRILAYIVQAGALFFGFGLAIFGEDRALYLQVALLLQLLVLALLLFERRS